MAICAVFHDDDDDDDKRLRPTPLLSNGRLSQMLQQLSWLTSSAACTMSPANRDRGYRNNKLFSRKRKRTVSFSAVNAVAEHVVRIEWDRLGGSGRSAVRFGPEWLDQVWSGGEENTTTGEFPYGRVPIKGIGKIRCIRISRHKPNVRSRHAPTAARRTI